MILFSVVNLISNRKENKRNLIQHILFPILPCYPRI